jgi:hypothetical protein
MEGTFVALQEWFLGWPVASPAPMFAYKCDFWRVEALAQTDGSIIFSVVSTDLQESMEVQSIQVVPNSNRIKFGGAFKAPDEFNVYANGVHIASLLPGTLAASAELPPLKLGTPVDFSAENVAASEARVRREAERIARPNYRLRTLDEEVRFLRASVLHLRESVAAINAGQDHTFHGVLATIRSLIAQGNRNFQPLIQRVAGRLEQPLLLYAPFYVDDAFARGIPTPIDYRYDVRLERETGDEAEVDLDVWLSTPAIKRDTGETVSQNEVIRLFADAAGSHFDPDCPPTFDEIECTTIYRGGTAVSVMIAYAARIGLCVCHLGDKLVAAHELSKQNGSDIEAQR